VLFWSRETRDLLRSFGWGIAALHRLHAATKLPRPRRPPHSVYLEGDDTLDEFLRQFPSVRLGQDVALLDLARETLSADALAA